MQNGFTTGINFRKGHEFRELVTRARVTLLAIGTRMAKTSEPAPGTAQIDGGFDHGFHQAGSMDMATNFSKSET